ncbi:MAG TPA: hypothetical protein V6D48_24635 [Oculatellaceae cyanobacterium]
MPPKAKPKAKSNMDLILENIFGLPADSSLHKALSLNGYIIPEDFLMEKDETINELEYDKDDGTTARIPKGNAGMLKTFKQYVSHLHNTGQPVND